METVIIFTTLLVILCFVLRLTFMRLLVMVAEVATVALVVIIPTDTAASMSKTQIDTWLRTPDLMMDMAVILTVDVGLQIAFCLWMTGDAAGRWALRLRRILLYIPGLLIFPVMFYTLVRLLFSLTGIDFDTAGFAMGVGMIVLFPLLSRGIKYLLPEYDIRLELIFYTTCIIALLGIVATVNGRTATIGVNEFNFPALLAISGLVMAGFVTGFLWYKHKLNKQS